MQSNVAKKRRIQAFLEEHAISQTNGRKKRELGVRENEACEELPLRRKQQKRSGGAAQERHNERRERTQKEETR
jgi:hypothetical protein